MSHSRHRTSLGATGCRLGLSQGVSSLRKIAIMSQECREMSQECRVVVACRARSLEVTSVNSHVDLDQRCDITQDPTGLGGSPLLCLATAVLQLKLRPSPGPCTVRAGVYHWSVVPPYYS